MSVLRKLFTMHPRLLYKILFLLVISLFSIIFYMDFSGIGDTTVPIYLNLEEKLCIDSAKSTINWRLERSTCPKRPIVTVVEGGRLGNLIWEYAAVWAVARITGLSPYVPYCIKSKLDEIFDNLTVPSLKNISHCNYNEDLFADDLESWTHVNQSIILPQYTTRTENVMLWIKDIHKEFVFNKKLTNASQNILRKAATNLKHNNSTQNVYVGVHVRRSDYMKYLLTHWNSESATEKFFHDAMAYYEQKYNDVIFVYVSDDPKWCIRHFSYKPNVYVATTKDSTPELDLAILSSCNHSIIDYGTYGAWGALMAGGEAVYYNINNSTYMTRQIGRILDYWRTI